MIKALLDEVDQVYEKFRDKLEKYKEYVKYLESLPISKLTFKEKEILTKHGERKNKDGSLKLIYPKHK